MRREKLRSVHTGMAETGDKGMSKSGIACYRNGGCGPYEMYSCSECPASKSDYLQHDRKQKAITNADCIRSMTDDMQLAIFFASVSGCPYDREIALDKCESWSNACVSCWLDWLKQEAEDG